MLTWTSFNDAWKAAVASGVPQNTVASLSCRANRRFTRRAMEDQPPFAWRLTVKGHPELNRGIDAVKCVVFK